jgi:D-glycero-D-manno-heptose 1,7-bisphosphate phosphatase
MATGRKNEKTGQRRQAALALAPDAFREGFEPAEQTLPRRPAVFLDRDGTINFQAGHTNHPSQIRVLEGAPEAIALINSLGFLAVVVTNQSAVARGKATEEQVLRCCSEVAVQVARQAAGRIDAFYYSPYHPDHPDPRWDKYVTWRKPEPGMLLAAARDFNIDLSRSWLVGDGLIDHQAAKAADRRIRTVLLPSDYHGGEGDDTGADYHADSLWDAVQIIFEETARDALRAG